MTTPDLAESRPSARGRGIVRTRKPRLATGVANHYAGLSERIYELTHSSGLGGLISVEYLDSHPRNHGRPTLVVSIYRLDPDVLVLVEGHDAPLHSPSRTPSVG